MTNDVKLQGVIKSDFTFSHALYGEKFYNVTLLVKRDSGKDDLIPALVSERLIDVTESCINKRVFLRGQFRSHNQHEETKTTLKLYVFVTEIIITDEVKDVNDVFLEGCLCKTPTYRHTPLGREISDMLLDVNRSYNKSDYIPCIAWGRNARFVKSLKVGDFITISGRIQSREYQKKLSFSKKKIDYF